MAKYSRINFLRRMFLKHLSDFQYAQRNYTPGEGEIHKTLVKDCLFAMGGLAGHW